MSTPAAAPVLSTVRDGAVLTVTLNRPEKRNALNRELWIALRDALVSAADDPAVRAVVLTGAGSAFCAGNDLEARPTDTHPLEWMRMVNDTATLLHELPTPTVAAVNGVAVGAGWNLALLCDLVVASSDARFSQVFAKRGLSVDFGGSWLLPRLVGLQQAKRLTMLADTVDADEALALGLATWVVPPEDLVGFARDVAVRLAAGPPVALAQTKSLLHQFSSGSLRDALAGEARAQVVNTATDGPAAYRAFRDGTEPHFTGTWQA